MWVKAWSRGLKWGVWMDESLLVVDNVNLPVQVGV